MAKKKVDISKVIFDAVIVVLGVAMLCFLAATFIKYEVTVLGETTTSATAGYDLLAFGDAYDTGVAVVLLLLVIFSSLMILGALMKLLADCNVIADKTYDKIASALMLISSLCVCVLSVVNMIVVANYAASLVSVLGTYSADWASLSAILIVGVASFVVSLLPVLKKTK